MTKNRSMLFRGKVAINFVNHIKTQTICGKNAKLLGDEAGQATQMSQLPFCFTGYAQYDKRIRV